LANKLALTKPNNKIFIIKTNTENINTKTKKSDDVAIFDVSAIVEIIKSSDKEFRNLYWGI